MTPFNPTIGIGKHRQIVESQSRLEVYGKGAHPGYVGYGVINGWPETKYEIAGDRITDKKNDPNNPRGIKDILGKELLAGVMTWSHGGGWKGPYISNEIWTDLNTYVLSHWAQNPKRSEEDLFFEFAESRNINLNQASLFRQIALLSMEGIRRGQLNSYTLNDKWWSRDEYFSVVKNKEVIDTIVANDLTEKILVEKAEAVNLWKEMELLSLKMTIENAELLEAIRVSCTYGRIKYELIEQMWILMLETAVVDEETSPDLTKIKKVIQRYDDLWSEWAALKEESATCATLYTDRSFMGKRKGSIGELVDRWRVK